MPGFTPEWVVKILQGMGVSGAIIFVLLTMLSGAIATIVILLRHSNKVYGYRLAERDKLNEALTKSADVLKDMLEVTEERNELTEEQAQLLKEQSAAFELLRVTIIAQFDVIKQNHSVAMDSYRTSTQVVGSIADALRTVHSMIIDNRGNFGEHINGIRVLLQDTRNAIEATISSRNEATVGELRRLASALGTEVTIVQRKRQVQVTRPTKKS